GNRLKSWKTKPISRRRRASSLVLTFFLLVVSRCPIGTPLIRISPLSTGSSWFSDRSRVVLPAPDGPISTTTCPRITSSETSSRTVRPPSVQDARWTETTGAVDAAVTLMVDYFTFTVILAVAGSEPRRDVRQGAAG